MDGVAGLGDQTEAGLGNLLSHLSGNGGELLVFLSRQKESGNLDLGKVLPERGLGPNAEAPKTRRQSFGIVLQASFPVALTTWGKQGDLGGFLQLLLVRLTVSAQAAVRLCW